MILCAFIRVKIEGCNNAEVSNVGKIWIGFLIHRDDWEDRRDWLTEELILSVANNLAEMEIREVRDGDKMEQLLLLIRTQISKVCHCSLFVCGPSHYEVIRAARTY